MARLLRKTFRRIEDLIAWALALSLIALVIAGLFWVVTAL